MTSNFSVGSCQDPGCEGATSEVALLGDFGGAGSTNPALYSDLDPATMGWGCNPDTCVPVAGSGALTRLQTAELAQHPVKVATSATTDEPRFQAAPPCSDPTKPTTGIIANPDAQKLGFCVDVNAISRSGQKCDAQDCAAWSGNLTIPVLFVNDPRFSFG